MKKWYSLLAIVVFLFLGGCTLDDSGDSLGETDYLFNHISGDLADEEPYMYQVSSTQNFVFTTINYESAYAVIDVRNELHDLTAYEENDDYIRFEYDGHTVEFEKLSESVVADADGKRFEYNETDIADREEFEQYLESVEGEPSE